MFTSVIRETLSGIVVIDLCRGQAGSVAGLLLAEAGAAVTKMELADSQRDHKFAVWDRGKSRTRASLEQANGQAILAALLAEADVLIHDFPPDRAEELNLGQDGLAERFPRLVVGALSAWPKGHPLDSRPTDGFLVLAELGILDEQAAVGREGPIFVRFPLADWGGAYLLAIGVLARLHLREVTGHGGGVATSLAQGALGPMMMHWKRAEKPTPAFLANITKDTPATLFECSDGLWLHLMSAVDDLPDMREGLDRLGPHRVAALNAACDGSQYYFLPNFGANREVFRTRPRQHWLDLFWDNDIAAQPCLALGHLYDDEQAKANLYVREVETADGMTLQPGSPFVISAAGQAAPTRTWPASPRRPLEGLRVLDFGMFLAGPFGPMLLADLGAEVIKVEPLRGDTMRPAEWVFTSCQRGKRDLAIDLRHPDAAPVLRRLIEWADVVHHNMRMPAAEKLGIGREAVRVINPSILYAHVSSYGSTGPRKDWPGYDQLFQACGGWEYEGAGEGNPPIWYRFGMVDHMTAMASIAGLLAALFRRDRTGAGARIDSSLLGTVLLTTGETHRRDDGSLAPYPRLDHAQMGVAPGRRLFRCKDGWVAFAGDADRLSAAFCTSDCGHLEQILRAELTASAINLAAGAGTMVRVREDYGAALFDDPEAIAAGLVANYPHRTMGRLEQLGAMWHFDGLDLALNRAPPVLGEHSREVLEQVGFPRDEIERLADAGVIVQFAG